MATASVREKKFRLFLGFFLLFSFLLSVLGVFWFSRSLDRWVFVFPTAEDPSFLEEVRYLKPVRGREESLKVMVREILLGSFNPLYLPSWERDTPLISLFLQGGDLYVNVGGSLLKEGEQSLVHFLEAIYQNVQRNFSFSLDTVTLAVEGETWYP